MNTFLRVSHPLFSWAVMVFLGLESIQERLFVSILIVFLGLGGMSQTFWQVRLKGQRPYARGDVISFGLGLLPVVVFPLLVWSEFLGK